MARTDPVARAQERAAQAARTKKVRELMSKSPIQRTIESGIRFVEDVKGLNIGGPESGRRAREKAAKKYQKSLTKREKYAP